ncbi:MAG: carbamoyl-phosphate synthase large subunit [Nitrospinae bacterium]|nr:carbamoyl-phosphate synthase large subunit [Nitrospinota bacterium]
MPKRTDIKKILLVGSGPIVIGQAAEFDYSGTQACKALKEEGFEVVLINSNPASVMTDPDLADRTYIEPINPQVVEMIIERERPDALLPTLGGQTGLNIGIALAKNGVLEKYKVEMIGAKLEAILKSEDRNLFKQAMERIGLRVPNSGYARSKAEGLEIIKNIPYPLIIRPSFTLGGTGGSVARNLKEFEECIDWAIQQSPEGTALIEESVIGWKEYELEVMRDTKDNVVIICSIENFDPMGVHTGDSITVAPAQTLTDKEYQIMRNAAIDIIREIGVETGGSNIQFGVDPKNGELVVIEMNPRVSRSSALASKATGFPIAKIAAKLAVGYTLDEIPNDITRETPASFEPTIDYCVVKFPRFAFEKFQGADQTLTTQMKSVGEVMSIGRTFKESMQKALRSLEISSYGLEPRVSETEGLSLEEKKEAVLKKLEVPNWERLWYVADAFRLGMNAEEVHSSTRIDPWFLDNILEIVEAESGLREQLAPLHERYSPAEVPNILNAGLLRRLKRLGFSDRRIAKLVESKEDEVRRLRKRHGVLPVFKRVDTCGAEFEAHTPYLYSTYEEECEAGPTDRKKVMILGGGPIRIGQGIEFDYCCVHGSFALREMGIESVMVNCNPETVSTDYDTSDRLYFEPLTFEDVMNIVELEKPYGVIVQFGGQTPLKLTVPLQKAGVRILGTSPESIDRAEDREKFKEMLHFLNLKQPDNGTATSYKEARRIAERIGYPVVVRPSYVLGGRAMEIVYDHERLERYMVHAMEASPDHPILIDKFLQDAIEIDVDAISDGETVVIGAIMEHIEEAGVHSGDSACSLPPYSISPMIADEIRSQTIAMARELKVIGLINIQFAIHKGEIYVLEVNPRASRTIPFVSKAIGAPLAKLAAKVMAGMKLSGLGFTKEIVPPMFAVKESVFPFIKFPGIDTVLGPEMKSTGEVMGIDSSFGRAFGKSQFAAGYKIPSKGRVFISVRDEDKHGAVNVARRLSALGFEIVATKGTHAALSAANISSLLVNKVKEGSPHVVDMIHEGKIDLIINTTLGKQALLDSFAIRRNALHRNIPCCTTIQGGIATAGAIEAMREKEAGVKSLQEYHGKG